MGKNFPKINPRKKIYSLKNTLNPVLFNFFLVNAGKAYDVSKYKSNEDLKKEDQH